MIDADQARDAEEALRHYGTGAWRLPSRRRRFTVMGLIPT